ncbi:MAG TPA: YicC/YloC family endoribonuclease, partial [Bacteroidia bacterium]|nr:YicC/YloC family endoribonuclease [Bacteroidia bacterium]
MKSMTGFGKATAEIPGKKVTVEVRSLNSKQLDLNLRLPYLYKEKELELRADISKQIERGKVDITVLTEATQDSLPVAINKTLAKTYYKELKSLSEELGESNQNLLSLVVKMPDVMKAEREVVELDEAEWKQIKATVDKAIDAFQKFRDDEGKTLSNEFTNRIGLIDNLLVEVVKMDAARVENIRSRIKNSLAEVIEKEKIDQNRFEQELVYYIEKLDITEEKLRLKTHIDYFLNTMKEAGSGRKLGFISQEIGREINTIGSKANDATVQKLVVQMKDELEKIKEQLL